VGLFVLGFASLQHTPKLSIRACEKCFHKVFKYDWIVHLTSRVRTKDSYKIDWTMVSKDSWIDHSKWAIIFDICVFLPPHMGHHMIGSNFSQLGKRILWIKLEQNGHKSKHKISCVSWSKQRFSCVSWSKQRFSHVLKALHIHRLSPSIMSKHLEYPIIPGYRLLKISFWCAEFMIF
jgi:hypothetical protein